MILYTLKDFSGNVTKFLIHNVWNMLLNPLLFVHPDSLDLVRPRQPGLPGARPDQPDLLPLLVVALVALLPLRVAVTGKVL